MTFVIRKLNDAETLGQKLKALRLAANRTLSEMAEQCKVRKPFLEAFETDRYDRLPASLYARNFLKSYVTALGGEMDYFLERYEAECGTCDFTTAARLPVRRRRAAEFLVASRFVTTGILSLFFLALVGYIGFQVSAITAAPKMAIEEPADGLSTDDATIKVAGSAEGEVSVQVNGVTVLLDQNGHFETEVALERGLNVITVEGAKRYSKSATLYRRVVLEQRAKSVTSATHGPQIP